MKRTISILAALLCIIGFRFLPAPSGMTSSAMQVLGIFIGALILWLTLSIFPGVTLAFIQVSASNWPESEANAELRPLLINYCVAGRSELLLDDGAYIYLKENDFAVSEQTAKQSWPKN